jgi:hypothetical protein
MANVRGIHAPGQACRVLQHAIGTRIEDVMWRPAETCGLHRVLNADLFKSGENIKNRGT